MDKPSLSAHSVPEATGSKLDKDGDDRDETHMVLSHTSPKWSKTNKNMPPSPYQRTSNQLGKTKMI